MPTIKVELSFISETGETQNYAERLNLDSDVYRSKWDFIASHMYREFHMQALYRRYRQQLPKFDGFSHAKELSPFPAGIADLTRMAAHANTGETWFQIQNTFFEAAHFLAQSRAYKDIEVAESEEELRYLTHLLKLQVFNLAAYLICKLEDWFLLLLFVNSGCSLIPQIDVHKPDWLAKVKVGDIRTGLKARKPSRKSNPYLDALSDEEYQAIRTVLNSFRKPKSVRIIREYRNEIAHRGLPAVDYPGFSPAFRFPVKHGKGISLGIGGRALIKYNFFELHEHAVGSLKHFETQLRKIKSIPILTPK